jgi:hypothetical protein
MYEQWMELDEDWMALDLEMGSIEDEDSDPDLLTDGEGYE